MTNKNDLHKLSLAGMLITLGVIFGDIGTSPLYVMKAIIGESIVTKQLVYGGVSSVFWTLLIITTFKYVYHALNADNRGEGGIFALYALIRKSKATWVIVPALVGAAALIADCFMTPAISISSSVEGLQILYPDLETMPIVLVILLILFSFQQVGTQIVGKTFGPIMVLWFTMLGVFGTIHLLKDVSILAALNPYYAIDLLINYPKGFWLLGAVFLCTTGAEALYSDLGHCGKVNVRVSWNFVLIMLMLNYLGQAANIMQFEGQVFEQRSSFYALMPSWFLPYGIGIATLAAVIASQAVITGAFTLVNEAMKLKLWVNMKVNFPTQMKGQIYIPAINWFLMIGCMFVVLIFKKSENMEDAYGVAIVIDMIMTTSLLLFYKVLRRVPLWQVVALGMLLIIIEGSFLISCLSKFTDGAWFSMLLAFILFVFTYAFYLGKRLRRNHTDFVELEEYVNILTDLQNDNEIPKDATNLVYMTTSATRKLIDSNVVYSLLRKKPRRADIYWFMHVDIMDDPYCKKYSVDTIVPGKIFFIKLQFGFKVEHKVNLMFHQIVQEMVDNNEVDELSHYPSLRKYNLPADFKFIIVNSRISVDTEINVFNQWIIRVYRMLKRLGIPTHEDFGLEITNVEEETVPINVGPKTKILLNRQD